MPKSPIMSFFNLSKLASKTKLKRVSCEHSHHDGVPLFLDPTLATSSLLKGKLQPLVELPKYVDPNEWLAANIVDFFEYINLFYGTVSYFCTPSTCSSMSAGPHYEYSWSDTGLRGAKLPAPQYIDYAMTWMQNCIDDGAVFPTKVGREFPRDFVQTARAIVRQMFRVFAHIFYAHYDKLVHLAAERHFNSLFAHFIAFCREFGLLDKKDMAPLHDLIHLLDARGVFG
ncbi:Maintenance of ploidy protein mob2 [Dispira simplex]|nr:Maintenance of ploidy protein mob2 [Dispira simplex]